MLRIVGLNFGRLETFFDTQRRWKTQPAGNAAWFLFLCTLLSSCKRYMYPWLLVCRINGSLIVWNFVYSELSFAGIDTLDTRTINASRT